MGHRVERELAGAVLPDRRLTARLGRLLTDLAARVGETVPVACQDWAATKAAATANPSFAAVRLIPDPMIEIVVPGGLILRVPLGADADAVAQLVVALRGRTC